MASHSSILAWKIPRAQEPGGQRNLPGYSSWSHKRVRHDWAHHPHDLINSQRSHFQIHWTLDFNMNFGRIQTFSLQQPACVSPTCRTAMCTCRRVIMSSCPAFEPVNGSYIVLCQTKSLWPAAKALTVGCSLQMVLPPCGHRLELRERNERGKGGQLQAMGGLYIGEGCDHSLRLDRFLWWPVWRWIWGWEPGGKSSVEGTSLQDREDRGWDRACWLTG